MWIMEIPKLRLTIEGMASLLYQIIKKLNLKDKYMYYENSSKKRSKFAIPYVIKRTWEDFWYEWHYPEHIRYGGGPQGYRTFRKQRLFNVIIIFAVAGMLLYVL